MASFESKVFFFHSGFVAVLNTNWPIGGFTPIVAIFYSAFHPTGGPGSLPSSVWRHCPGHTAQRYVHAWVDSFQVWSGQVLRDSQTTAVQPARHLQFWKVRRLTFLSMSPIPIPRNFFCFDFRLFSSIEVNRQFMRRLSGALRACSWRSKSSLNSSRVAPLMRLLTRCCSKSTKTLTILQNAWSPLTSPIPSTWSYSPFRPHQTLNPTRCQFQPCNCGPWLTLTGTRQWKRLSSSINGINSVRRIADLAEADYDLVRKCIRRLMRLGW